MSLIFLDRYQNRSSQEGEGDFKNHTNNIKYQKVLLSNSNGHLSSH